MGRVRQRGEGNTEYVILLLFVLICAVVGLFSSFSGSLKRIRLDKGLCLDCSEKDKAALKNEATPPKKDEAKDKDKPGYGTGDDKDKIEDPNDPNAPNATVSSPPDAFTAWWDAFRDFLAWWY